MSRTCFTSHHCTSHHCTSPISKRVSQLLFLVWAVLLVAGCQSVENVGYLEMDSNNGSGEDTSGDSSLHSNDSESDTNDTEDDQNDTSSPYSTDVNDTDDDNFMSYMTANFEISDITNNLLLVNPHDNPLGLQGAWYTYNDGAGTTNELYFDQWGSPCIRGDVAPYTDAWTYAGLGVGLCYNPEQSQFSYALSNCPYVPNTYASEVPSNIVGFAFSLYNPSMAQLDVHIIQEPLSGSFYYEIIDQGDEYLQWHPFHNSYDASNYDDWNFLDTTNIEFQVWNSDISATSFDFCIDQFSLVIQTN